MNVLVESGVSDRILRESDRHDGIELWFNDESHRVDFKGPCGGVRMALPQGDVFLDLAACMPAATAGTSAACLQLSVLVEN